MKWILDKGRPLCPQICEQVCAEIATEELLPGEKLMSVREVALSAGVNPNTVQKAFEQLEGQGVLQSQRGSGWYVAENITPAKEILKELRTRKTTEYLQAMQALGMDPEDVLLYLSRLCDLS